MNIKLARLAERRERLVALSAVQRETIRQSAQPWRVPLARIDQGLEVLRYVRGHPVVMAGAGLLLLKLRRSSGGPLAGHQKGEQNTAPPSRNRRLRPGAFLLRLLLHPFRV